MSKLKSLKKSSSYLFPNFIFLTKSYTFLWYILWHIFSILIISCFIIDIHSLKFSLSKRKSKMVGKFLWQTITKYVSKFTINTHTTYFIHSWKVQKWQTDDRKFSPEKCQRKYKYHNRKLLLHQITICAFQFSKIIIYIDVYFRERTTELFNL